MPNTSLVKCWDFENDNGRGNGDIKSDNKNHKLSVLNIRHHLVAMICKHICNVLGTAYFGEAEPYLTKPISELLRIH